MYHYVYKLELPETKEYYFGSRTSKVEPIKAVYYLGSMKSWKPDKKKLVKTIIRSDFENREECIRYERELIIKHRLDCLNRNAHIPGVGFLTIGLGQYIDENGKVIGDTYTETFLGLETFLDFNKNGFVEGFPLSKRSANFPILVSFSPLYVVRLKNKLSILKFQSEIRTCYDSIVFE